MSTKREDFQNRALALLLRQQGLDADFEQAAGRRRIDVVARVDGLRVVLEAETGFNRKAQAIKDADARLKQGLTVAAFAVCYPLGVTEETLHDATLTWTLRTRAGLPAGEWAVGDIPMLARAVRQTPASLSGADVGAQILSDALDEAVAQIGDHNHRRLAEALDLPANRPGTGRSENVDSGYRVAAKRGLLVVVTAMLFHNRLQDHLPVLRPTGYAGNWPPDSMSVCAGKAAAVRGFQDAWAGILAVDYRPVFETGRAALAALSDDPDTALAVRNLAGAVSAIAQRVTGLRHDLLGRIFHRVLDTARYDGSFYTSTAAAVLLTTLALKDDAADWGDLNELADLRICDPACGTGTLLMAAAERIRDLWNAVGERDIEDERALDLALVEDVLWGYDSNLTATHMAAATLGMMSPSTQFNRINVHRVRLGVFDGVPYVGSLEFLEGQARLAAWPALAERVEGDTPTPLPQEMDLVVMNPPFTRDSLRYDQFSARDERAVKDREKNIVSALPQPYAARLSGAANAFLVLSNKMVNADAGTLAVVLPSAIATNPAAFYTRQFLAQEFHVDTIVSSHDPERIYFSENTSIGEVLVICRRRKPGDSAAPTRVVSLARNPATPVAALDTAARIERAGMDPTAARDFTVQEVDAARIAEGDWSAINFLSPFLVNACRSLVGGEVSEVAMTPLRRLADVGPAGQRIRDAYTKQQMPTALGRRALWHHKTDAIQSMSVEPDVYIEPKTGRELLADDYWAQRSDMLLPHRLRLNVSRVSAVILPERVVGSIWTPCRVTSPGFAKPLCLYLNSTPGLLAMLGGRDNRVPSYPSFSLDTLRSLPVPDFAEVDRGAIDHLAGWFDWLQDETLLPFPQMDADPVRRQIDDVVVKALGIDPEWVATVRREMVREPSVTDRRVAISNCTFA